MVFLGLEGQLFAIDLLDEGLYFSLNGPTFRFPAVLNNICAPALNPAKIAVFSSALYIYGIAPVSFNVFIKVRVEPLPK